MKNRNTLKAMRSIAGTRSRWLCAIALLAALALAPALLASCDDGSGGGGGSAIDGRWSNLSGTTIINISGAAGSITALNHTSGAWFDARNKGMLKIGDQLFRNITQTGDRTWSGQELIVLFYSTSPNVAERISYQNVTITLSSNSRTISTSGGGTWNRQ